MAITATAPVVIRAQRPPGLGMVERLGHLLAFLPVASPARAGDFRDGLIHVSFMAPEARFVVFGDGARRLLFAFFPVATCAAFFVVAVYAFQVEAIDVFPMAEDHDRFPPFLELGTVDFRFRCRDRRMHPAQNTVCGRQLRLIPGSRPDSSPPVTDGAIGRVSPVLVAVQALTVIRTLEAGLVDTGAVDRNRMTRLAGGVILAFRRVMMADGAAVCHFGHFGVAFMVEGHGQVSILQFVEDHHFRPELLSQSVGRRLNTGTSR